MTHTAARSLTAGPVRLLQLSWRARNYALVDGNKRLGWTACRTFLAINGQWISAHEDECFDFLIRVASDAVPDLHPIAEQLRAWRAEEG